MKSKILNKTNEKVYTLGLGTFGHGEAYGGISRSESFEIVKSVIQFLGNDAKVLVDTAPKYGNGYVEEWLGEFVKKIGSEKVLIATKGGRHIEASRANEKDFTSTFLKLDLENSLRRMGANRVFLYQLHNPSMSTIEDGSVFELLESFRTEGKIEYYGVSIDEPEEGIAVIEACRKLGFDGLISLQVIYNLLNKKAEKELFGMAHKNNVGIIARETMLRGLLTGKYSENSHFSNVSEAVAKEIKKYGRDQILKKVEEIKKIVIEDAVQVPLTQIAIKFSITHPYVTLSILGINRLKYVETDLTAEKVELKKDFLTKLKNVDDLVELK